MKKSQLKKIIKESIKQLVTEQTQADCDDIKAQTFPLNTTADFQACCEATYSTYAQGGWWDTKCKAYLAYGQNTYNLTFPEIVSCCPGCVEADFSYLGACGTQWLVPAPGGANSWNNWLTAKANAYFVSPGVFNCNALTNNINWLTTQLGTGGSMASGTLVLWNTVQLARKQAQIDWLNCMLDNCNC